MKALGDHILVEYYKCTPEILNDVSLIEESMVNAATEAGATVINSTFHHFSPYGVSGVVVIQESHLAIHTWPEYGYAAVDLFTCGDQVDTWAAFKYLEKAFESKNQSAMEMKRGSTQMLDKFDFDITSMREESRKHTNPQKYTRNLWFTDKDDNQALSIRYTGEVLFKEKSPYQLVTILDTYKYGKMLTLDNMVMTTEKDEFHYHEMISHPAMFAHGKAKNVLVIGGGDGGTIREVLRHEGVEKVTMVEIDEAVIRACKEHLPTIAAEFDNPKLDLIVGDGIDFVKKAADEAYDIILVDGSDPVGPAEGLFSTEFYENCKRILTDNGILVAQGESPRFGAHAFKELNHCFKDIFGKENVFVSLFYVTTYPTGMWSFQLASKGGLNIPEAIDVEQVKKFTQNHDLKYYNEKIHPASFAIPGFVTNMLND